MGSLASMAVLTELHISDWRGRAADTNAAETVEKSANAARGTTSVRKALIRPEALADVRGIGTAARNSHHRLSLPWSDTGLRLLPAALVDEYQTTMETHRTSYTAAVGVFLATYPAEIKLQAAKLGDLFNPDDYPTEAEIIKRFALDWEIQPIPSAADIRVDLDPRTRNRITADLERREHERMLKATQSLRDMLGLAAQDVLDMLSYRLPTKTCLVRLADACGRVEKLNLAEVTEINDVLPALKPIATADRARWEREAVKQSDAALLTWAINHLKAGMR